LELWRRNVYVLWVAVFIAAACWTMVMPFMPVYLERELGVTSRVEFWTGVMGAIAAVCNMVMAPVWGAIGDRWGRRLSMLRSGFFLTLGYVLFAMVRGPLELLGVRMMIGLLTGFVPMAVALVGVSTPPESVGYAMGLVQTAWPSGAIIGPVLGGLLSGWVGIRGASWVAAGMIGVTVATVTLTVREEFTPPPKGERNLLQDVQAALTNPLLMAVIVITTASMASVMSLEPVLVPYAKRLAGPGSPDWLAGLLYALPGVSFIALAPFWARRGNQVGFERTIALGLLGSALLYALQALAGGAWQLGALRLLAGVTGAAIGPGVAALLATAVPPELRGRAFGLNQAASAAGSIVGPLLGGFIGSFVDARAVFLVAGLIYLGGYLWVKRVVAPRLRAAGAGRSPA
jgi:MFS transporter, DHA1 family, multidrug resistance protein